MKIKELEHKIRQVRSLVAEIREITDIAGIYEDRAEDVTVVIGSVSCRVPAHSATIMLRAEGKRLKEVRAILMNEINPDLEDDDEPQTT